MKELERDLLRQESEYYLNDDTFGKISETVLRLLDKIDELESKLQIAIVALEEIAEWIRTDGETVSKTLTKIK